MRRAAAILAAAALAVTLTPAPAAQPATRTYVATTLNERNDVGPVRAESDLRRAARGSDLLFTQENSRRRVATMLPSSFDVVQPADEPRSLALAWRRSAFTRLGSFPILLSRSTLFDSASRDALAVMLRPTAAPSTCLVAVVVHLIPHIEVGGRPRELPRKRLVAREIRRLAAFLQTVASRCSVLVGGDWNIDGYADRRIRDPIFPAARLSAIRYSSSWALPKRRPTLGNRYVDGFYFRHVSPISARTLIGFYSDHNASRLTIRTGN